MPPAVAVDDTVAVVPVLWHETSVPKLVPAKAPMLALPTMVLFSISRLRTIPALPTRAKRAALFEPLALMVRFDILYRPDVRPVAVDRDAGVVALVVGAARDVAAAVDHQHAPAPLRQRARRRGAREPGADHQGLVGWSGHARSPPGLRENPISD